MFDIESIYVKCGKTEHQICYIATNNSTSINSTRIWALAPCISCVSPAVGCLSIFVCDSTMRVSDSTMSHRITRVLELTWWTKQRERKKRKRDRAQSPLSMVWLWCAIRHSSSMVNQWTYGRLVLRSIISSYYNMFSYNVCLYMKMCRCLSACIMEHT